MYKFILCLWAFCLSLPIPRAPETHEVYLPVILQKDGIKGVAIWPGMAVARQKELIATQSSWITTDLDWGMVEETKGVYVWPAAFEADYEVIKATGARLIVILKMSPAWARTDPRECGRILPEAIPAFAEFARQAVIRYPYISIVIVGNEIDYETGMDGYFGCWGDASEPYFGGAYYATVINPVYQAVHSTRSSAQVYFAGLALETNTAQKDYFEGAVRAGAKFDGVPFHHYNYYPAVTSPEVQVNVLRQVMTTYGYTRPIILSETSLLYLNEGDIYEQAQAQYVRFMYQEALRLNLQAFIWYTLPDSGWYHSGLMEGQRLKPAYFEIKNLNYSSR